MLTKPCLTTDLAGWPMSKCLLPPPLPQTLFWGFKMPQQRTIEKKNNAAKVNIHWPSLLVQLDSSSDVEVVVEGCHLIPYSVYRWWVCQAFCTIHEVELMEILWNKLHKIQYQKQEKVQFYYIFCFTIGHSYTPFALCPHSQLQKCQGKKKKMNIWRKTGILKEQLLKRYYFLICRYWKCISLLKTVC